MIIDKEYKVSDLAPYIDWSYFLHAWQLPVKYVSAAEIHDCQSCRAAWIGQWDAKDRPQAREAFRLMADDARKMLCYLESKVKIRCRVGLFEANADNDDILIFSPQGDVRIPCLRQQVVKEDEPCLCLADFVRPMETGRRDRVGAFATTVLFDYEKEFKADDYKMMLSQTLCDRLAEAAACVLHLEVRRNIWAYAPDEDLTIPQLLHEKNQGIRPAVGYPILPDQSLNFLLEDLILMSEIGIRLTENGAMRPHATVTGLMIAYAHAKYFAVGQIDENQLKDYAQRRGLPEERMRQFLAANLRNV